MKLRMLVAFFLCLSAVLAFGVEVACVYNSWPDGTAAFSAEYDEPVRALGWNMTKYENIQLPELTKNLDKYQMVIFSTVSNMDKTVDMAPYANVWRNYIENGGILLVTDASYDTVNNKILKPLGPEFNIISGTCIAQNQPSDEHSKVTFTANSLYNFPTPVIPLAKELGFWSHFHSFPNGWEHIECCFENVPLTMARNIGNGLAVLTVRYSLMKPYEKKFAENFLCNILARQKLREKGLVLSNVIPPANAIEANSSFTLTGPLEVLQTLTYHLEYPGDGQTISLDIKPEITGTTAVFSLPIHLYARKKTTINFNLKADDEILFAGSWQQDCPPLMEVKARRVFIYPDDPTLSLFVYLAPDSINDGPYTAVFAIDGKEIEQQSVAQAEELFSLDVSSLPAGKHVVSISLRNEAGDELANFTQDFTALAQNATAHIAPNGSLYLNGKPFFPMGFYHVSWRVPAEHRLNMVRDLAQHGFNCVHVSFKSFEQEGDDFTALLDECQKLGIYVIPEFGCDPIPVIQKYKNHPAILGWDPGDEPESHGHSPEEMFRRYAKFKEIDPEHLVYTVICTPTQYKNYASGADVLAPDPYPIPTSYVDYAFGRYEQAYGEARKYGTTMWSVPQAFGNYSGWGRQPTGDEYRAIVYLSLMAGAKGFNNFTYFESTFFLPDCKELYEACLALPNELKPVQDFFLLGERTILQKDNAGIYITQWTCGDRNLYVIVNSSVDKAKEFTIEGDFSKCVIHAGTLQNGDCTQTSVHAALASMGRLVIIR